MGTITDEGCHAVALDDEPIFTLLARDPCGPEIIRYWITLREAMIGRGEKPEDDHQKLEDAAKVAQDMVTWRSDATDPTQWEHGPRWRYPRAPLMLSPDRFADDTYEYIKRVDECDDDQGPLFEILHKRLDQFDGQDKVTLTVATLRRVTGDTRKRMNAAKEIVSDQDTRRALLLSKIGVGLQQVTGEMAYWAKDVDQGNPKVQQLNGWIDRLNGYAKKAQAGVGIVTDEAIDRVRTDTAAPQPTDEPVRLVYDRWLKWEESAMPIGNRFLLGVHAGRLYFSEFKAPARNETPEWGPLYLLQKSNQADMLVTLHRVWSGIGKHATAREADHSAFDQMSGRDPKNGFAKGLGDTIDTDSLDVTATPELPPHRFTLFEKTDRWAYGRGLEINPAHIPAMLDRMQDDGWLLHCVLGGVERDKFGMIFRRFPAVAVPRRGGRFRTGRQALGRGGPVVREAGVYRRQHPQ